ncbi:hypothetical protein [Ewingella americana]|uniref:hypothetical protein n=1 Tax=Ewingella americana TaxID=41202 RepID=UPI00163AF8D0|nr:hypothetical protein [Ewingella americana]QMV54106.1 hypothetical protein GXP68_22875 [Ewingella americana]
MSNVTEFHAARLDAIELAIQRLAISISESGGSKAEELAGSVEKFREKIIAADASAYDKDVYIKTVRLLDPLVMIQSTLFSPFQTLLV